MPLFAPITRALNRLPTLFGYDAGEQTTHRKNRSISVRTEDKELNAGKRRKVVSNSRDLNRNFSIAGWAIRKHLDFVSSSSYRARTKNKAFNKTLEAYIESRSLADVCDAAGRHPFPRLVRLMEMCRMIDGDILPVKLRDGSIQMIEGDRVRDPEGGKFEGDRKSLVHGVQVDKRGRAVAYAVHERTDGGGFRFEGMASADDARLFGYYSRIDQVRGVSPIVSAIHSMTDVYEGINYALCKAKVAQLFGMKFTRDANVSPGNLTESEDSEDGGPRYKVKFGDGPFIVDLNAGDDAEFLENKTPSNEFREFIDVVIGISLKSIDIPYSFYDEGYTNFFGSRSALLLYLQSCKSKRSDICEFKTGWSDWQIRRGVALGELVLPSGMTTADCVGEWVPDGIPWWDPSKEIKANLEAVDGCLQSRRRICKEVYGIDFFDVVDEIAEELDYMEEKKVNRFKQAAAPTPPPNDPSGDDDKEGEEEKDDKERSENPREERESRHAA